MNDKVSPSERDAETASSNALKAEYAKEYDQAFRLYLKAAEAYLHLSRSMHTTDKVKQQWKINAGKCLERAEKIKRFAETSRGQANAATNARALQPSVQLTPIGIDHFSPQEQFYVLKKGGKVNNLYFEIWDDSTSMKSASSSIFSDPDGQPTLSPEQKIVNAVWRRPLNSQPSSPAVYTPRKILPQQILQHIVTDCSVCASISVCLEHAQRFSSTLESGVRKGVPFSSLVEGRYDVRVYFNGIWRRVIHFRLRILEALNRSNVVVDDKLPFHPSEETLMCMSVIPDISTSQSTPSPGPDTLWPSFLEKAYMKLRGGYDFPGSNSSIDLHALAGWIPEHVDLQGSSFEREKTWERIKTGFSSGKCVVTLGTGPSPYILWRNTPLLQSHSYAVIDVHETAEGDRILNVLNSWVTPSEGGPEYAKELRIPWAEVLNTFDGVYLSWDPQIWHNTLTFHGMWKRSLEDEEGTRQVQIKYDCSGTAEEIWILLTRHVTDTSRTTDFISLRVDLDDDQVPAAILTENQRVLSSKGTYTNSTHILVRKKIPQFQLSGILSVSVSYDGNAREVGFTLTAYSSKSTGIAWMENKTIPPYTNMIKTTFTSKTSGGNCMYPTFMNNPEWELVIPPDARLGSKARLSLDLQASRETPVNVAVVWSQNQRVTELLEKDLVATSGAYNYGSAHVTKTVNAGTYVIIPSAFEPHHLGPFSLKVDSSIPFTLKSIAQEGAGMYCKTIRGTWEDETAGGAPSFNKYIKNPTYELIVPSATQMKIRLQCLQHSSVIPLNVAVYSDHGGDVSTSLRHQQVATSGAYNDSIAGAATPQFPIGPGKYYVIPSTLNPGTTGGFRMMVHYSVSNIKVAELRKADPGPSNRQV